MYYLLACAAQPSVGYSSHCALSRVTVTGATKADNTEGDKKADAKVIGPENVTSSYLVLSGTHFRGGRQLGEYTIKSVRAPR